MILSIDQVKADLRQGTDEAALLAHLGAFNKMSQVEAIAFIETAKQQIAAERPATTQQAGPVTTQLAPAVENITRGSEPAGSVNSSELEVLKQRNADLEKELEEAYAYSDELRDTGMGLKDRLLNFGVDSLDALDWETPKPLDDDLSPVLPFDENLLPVAIRPWITDVVHRMSVPLDFAGVCALVTLAGVTGRRAFVYPRANDKEWRESISLSGAVVAPSGRTKTPTWKTFINFVIEQEADWRKEYDRIYREYEVASKKYNDVLAEQKKDVRRGKKTSVDLNSKEPQELTQVQVGGEPEEPPPARRCILMDSTPEKMHSVMEGNPEGILYYRDELSGWVSEFEKKGYEVQRSICLAAMNGNDFYTMDRIERGSVSAVMCASVFGSFQPEIFRNFLSNTGNVADGLIPRFSLLIWPDLERKPQVDQAADHKAKDTFRRIVRTLAEMKAETIKLHFDGQAQPVFDAWLEKLDEKVSQETNFGKRSHFSKYRGALPKLAALLQLVDMVALGGNVRGNIQIDVDHLQKALGLIAYFESHAHRIYDCIRTPVQSAEHALAEHLQHGDLKNGFSIRDVYRNHWTGLTKPDVIEAALDNLGEKGWVRAVEIPVKTRGRPTIKWDVNPVLPTLR